MEKPCILESYWLRDVRFHWRHARIITGKGFICPKSYWSSLSLWTGWNCSWLRDRTGCAYLKTIRRYRPHQMVHWIVLHWLFQVHNLSERTRLIQLKAMNQEPKVSREWGRTTSSNLTSRLIITRILVKSKSRKPFWVSQNTVKIHLMAVGSNFERWSLGTWA